MAMTGRERVRRCLEFAHPDRVPRHLWTLPICLIEHGEKAIADYRRRWPDDIAWADVSQPELEALRKGTRHAIGQYVDEWGCTWENIQAGVIGEIKNPMLDDWSKLDRVRPPNAAFRLNIEEVNRYCASSDCCVIGGGVDPFQRIQHLRGSENLLTDLAEQPAELFELIRIVHEWSVRYMEVWARTKVDAVAFADDWGSQRSLLISPALWRRVFKPLYAEYVRIVHDAGKKIFMHSDGYIMDIYEDLVEIGIDAINSQLFCMDIEEIGRRFKGRVTFWGEIDRQHILPRGTGGEVRAAVERVVDNLYQPAGGVIAQFEFGAATRLANAHAVYEAWEELTPAPMTAAKGATPKVGSRRRSAPDRGKQIRN